VGGWISDKVGGSIVTQVISAVMVVASVAVGYVMMQAYGSATPEQYFPPSWACSCCCSSASGIGNGSTFRTIGVIFDRQQAGPVLGWTSAVAAYGAFIAPVVIGAQIKAGTPQIRDVRLRRLLRPVPGAELVVLPARQRLREEPLSNLPVHFPRKGENHEPLSRSTDLFLQPASLLRATASPPAKTAPGRTPTATAGRTTRSCAPPTA
jgi:MFS family permease